MSKFFSLEWFKSRVEKTTERVIENRLDKLINEIDNVEPAQECRAKLYLNAKLVNDTLIVVKTNGEIISKPGATKEDFENVLAAGSMDDLNAVMFSEVIKKEKAIEVAEINKIKNLQSGIKTLGMLSDFIVEGNTVFLNGTSRSLPQLLVEKFIEVVDKWKNCPSENLQDVLDNDEEYQSLKRFFMWCCLNPRAEVANELYRFLSENSFRITKQGFFVALRNVVTLHGSPELVHFISNTYNKVKAVWKKNPDYYTVFLQDGEYKLVHDSALTTIETHTSTTCTECDGSGGYNDWEDEWVDCHECGGTGEVDDYTYSVEVPVDHGTNLGKLTDLYLDLPNREENRFTDDWTKTFDIRIGQVTNMPQEDCNWSTQDCAAAGLHFTADQIHYVGCGDQSVLVLINPMKVVGIGQHKGRCYEYLPIMTVPREEATSILHDISFDTLELDEDYAIRELESLAEKAQIGFVTESSKYEFNIPQMSSKEISNIVLSLNDMKKEITKRVTIIK